MYGKQIRKHKQGVTRATKELEGGKGGKRQGQGVIPFFFSFFFYICLAMNNSILYLHEVDSIGRGIGYLLHVAFFSFFPSFGSQGPSFFFSLLDAFPLSPWISFFSLLQQLKTSHSILSRLERKGTNRRVSSHRTAKSQEEQ
jgi:hypothetical protein